MRREDSDLSLDWGADSVGSSHNQGSQNVVELLQEMKEETMDDDLQNLDPAFLQGMNLHSLVREFEMEATGGTDLGVLSLADDCLN